MTTFTLTIKLGDDAMQNGVDLSTALDRVGARVAYISDPSEGGSGSVRDVNGNTVGSWEVTA